MKKVALHGSYYGDNFGDTLFVTEYINWLKEIFDYDKDNVHLPFAGKRVRDLVKISDRKGISSIYESDIIVFIGGGYLGEPSKKINKWSIRLIIRHLSVGLVALALKKPYIFIGVGAGPLSNGIARRLTTFLCNRSNKVVVRDQESRDYLVSYGVDMEKIDVTADSVLCLKPEDVNTETKNELLEMYEIGDKECQYIGVHLPAVNKNEIKKLRTIINDLKYFCERFKKYKIVVFNDFYKENYIYLAYLEIKEVFEQSTVIYVEYKNPNQLIALIDELDIVITTKLHCGIVANCLGKYTLSISTHNKTLRLYKQLGLLNRNISFSEYSKGRLIDMLSEYKEDVKFYNNVPDSVREAALKNKEYLLNYMKK